MAQTASSPDFLETKRGAMSASLARNWWAVMLRGIATFAFGVAAIFMPGLTLFSLVLVFAIYMLVDGVLDIIAAVRAAGRQERWGFLMFEGVADLIAGAVALTLPHAALFAFVILAAIWAVVSGVLMLASAFRLQREHGRIWLIVGGIASVVWGALLGLFPVAGLVVLTWWLGAYALVFGASLLALGVTLRVRRGARVAAAAPAAPAAPAS